MFDKILIANRGEIACRIIKTCRRLGIKTVAVYSEADADTLHVRQADEAVHIGGAAASESYLQADRIIEAAKRSGAQAIHPGFGFLSERASFVEAVEAAGLVFIGPPANAIAAMGDKIESKRLADKAGVNTVPGYIGEIDSAEDAVRIAEEVGLPVMIKASAGGGGKGMRIARSAEEVRDGFRSAQNEARGSFGDERVFIERYVEQPRHIEIQILADGQGRCLYLWERECSIQRRHQKVVEEAPSPFLDEETRKAMGEQAVALSEAVGYRSAGTVEFIVDQNRNFFFLEMNTRLQVEHPVTEMITGLDLVEWMIRIAAGERLSFGQDEVRRDGWAVETRVYAEDPARGFLPSIGRLRRYQEPKEEEGVRVDSGVQEGAEISMYYDPMIAKLVTWGPDREAAIDRHRTALDAYYVRGVDHNMAFLSAVMAHPRFREGRLSTDFIAEEFPDGFTGRALSEAERDELSAVAAYLELLRQARGEPLKARELVVEMDREQKQLRVEPSEGGILAHSGERAIRVEGDDWWPGQPLLRCRVDGRPMTLQVDALGPRLLLRHDGTMVSALVLRRSVGKLAALMPVKEPPDLSKFVLSPMPGLLVTLKVEVGMSVKAGEEVAVVEAMKMENVLRALADGMVKEIHAQPGDSLSVDQKIVEFE
ncbi:acetyl-CoA carboxylase biotin carboxylase subunit [Aquibaculum arenosum]|uniref:propionyl-CoA carboxylase n=1 Tax=Aquibaculum arenosum TaxID=3032591 RepID=A0ABT5YIC8_9PROT|nr:acetyl/propionyl/methylcrotonyl-CoA carboxylase subunit alpha [Fodinicurvata sp. CAU 1616]MDF2094686.1 acetyl/propionyl/methylcrotonyl-CoA carboxylase subunit alpha [Fodinicurvata sp. CAU 1616]